MKTVDEILAGRECVMAKDVYACFLAKTGRSIGPNTLAAWRAMDPSWSFQPPGQRYWLYDWPRLWEWYKTAGRKVSIRRTKVG